jgi:hypothetical protein
MTFHDALNSGAVLQAYALQSTLEKMGHNVEFIDFRPVEKRTIKSFFAFGLIKTLYKWESIFNAYKYSYQRKYWKVLKVANKRYYNISEIKSFPPDYDVYIAGSDQIWNVGTKNDIDEQFYLNFGSEKTRRIAYAASFGQCDIPEYLNDKIKTAILKFDAVSVRESNGVEYLKRLVGNEKEIFHLCDPTLLLSYTDYKKIFELYSKTNSKPYIASYILSELSAEKLKLINSIKILTRKKLINLRNPDTCIRLKNANNTIVNPYQWLSYIYNSDLVICCSFHAVVFSLLFHKQFIVLTPFNNERIESILNTVGLSGQIYRQLDNYKLENIIYSNIDWDIVDEKINIEKQKSMKFLKNNLS